jgi:lysyl-tRNA synthetase class 2
MASDTHFNRMRLRAHTVRAIRQFFETAGFIEVDTPVLTQAPAPEPHIEALQTHVAPETSPRFLQTSPELPMKRLLAQGWERIFQIAPVFRDNDHSPLHTPEFRMLEWYRLNTPWTALLDDCENLLHACLQALNKPHHITYQNQPLHLEKPFIRISMEEAFQRYAGFSILECLERSALLKALQTHHIHHNPEEPWDDLFFRVFLSRVEPAIVRSTQPVFLTHFPAPLAALAQRDPTDPRVSQRFECYIAGLELTNGFGELTEPQEQTERFKEALAERAAKNMRTYPMPHLFLHDLKNIPSASGIALGLERLLMILLDVPHIRDVCFIPWEEA